MKHICSMVCVCAIVLLVSGLIGCESTPSGKNDSPGIQAEDYVLSQDLPEQQRKKVLLLHSYNPEYIWVEHLNQGIVKGLAEERYFDGRNTAIKYFYMDTKRKADEGWKRHIAGEAVETIRRMNPDVVIATDDNAQKYVVRHFKDSKIPFVFAGVNADPANYGYLDTMGKPGHNVTGSIERERFEQSIRFLRRLKPGIEKIAVICDDSPTGAPVIDRVKKTAPRAGVTLTASLQTDNFDQWKKFVLDQQNKADALLVVVYHTVKDNNGRNVSPDAVLNWTISNNKLPDFGFWSWAVSGGLLCSEAISGYQQGYYAGTIAAYVLRGQTPSEFAVGMPQRGEPCINLARAKMLGIKIAPDLQRSATLYSSIESAK
ncbi:MAG: ABC transporter substrate binding protein [Desulfosarcinaceae bacterium]